MNWEGHVFCRSSQQVACEAPSHGGAGDTRGRVQGCSPKLTRLVFSSAAARLAAGSCTRRRAWPQARPRLQVDGAHCCPKVKAGYSSVRSGWIICPAFIPNHWLRSPWCTSPPFSPMVLLQESLGMRRSCTKPMEDHLQEPGGVVLDGSMP